MVKCTFICYGNSYKRICVYNAYTNKLHIPLYVVFFENLYYLISSRSYFFNFLPSFNGQSNCIQPGLVCQRWCPLSTPIFESKFDLVLHEPCDSARVHGILIDMGSLIILFSLLLMLLLCLTFTLRLLLESVGEKLGKMYFKLFKIIILGTFFLAYSS